MIQDPALRINSGIWIIAFRNFMMCSNFAAFCLIGTHIPRGLPKCREAAQVARQFFHADFDFRSAETFREKFRLSCASLLMRPNTCSTRLRTRDLRRLHDF